MSLATKSRLEAYIEAVPKIELHVHIEGTLEPQQMFRIGARNQIQLKGTPESHRESRKLETYEQQCSEACNVLREQLDFYELMYEYLKQASIENVYAAEIFFDPLLHTRRGVPIQRLLHGFRSAIVDGYNDFSIKCGLVMHISHLLPLDTALEMLNEAYTYIVGVSVDSNYPCAGYASIIKKVKELGGLKLVTHLAGDKANNSCGCAQTEDAVRYRSGLYCCAEAETTFSPAKGSPFNMQLLTPQSFVMLKKHLDSELEVTASSPYPAFSGFYLMSALLKASEAGLTEKDVYRLCHNALQSSFLTLQEREHYMQQVQHSNVAIGCAPPPKSVTVFGSRATQPGTPDYRTAEELSRLFSLRGFKLVTGGYSGIMEATSKGAVTEADGTSRRGDGNSAGIAMGILSPRVFPEAPLHGNDYNSHNVIARTLLDRFWMYLRDSEYFVAFGGTIGTITEILVVWSVASSRLSHRGVPQKILLWRPHWQSAMENLIKSIGISSLDTSLLIYVDSVQEAVELVEKDFLLRTASATLC